jgi:hypothetical protein
MTKLLRIKDRRKSSNYNRKTILTTETSRGEALSGLKLPEPDNQAKNPTSSILTETTTRASRASVCRPT